MTPENPEPEPEPDPKPKRECGQALRNLWRTLEQAFVVVVVVGAITGVYQLTQSGHGNLLDLETVATAAGSGIMVAAAAWAHRYMEEHLRKNRKNRCRDDRGS